MAREIVRAPENTIRAVGRSAKARSGCSAGSGSAGEWETASDGKACIPEVGCTVGTHASVHAHAVPVATARGMRGRRTGAEWEDLWVIPSGV